ncbi:MAG: CapA family protein [Actinomycetes bacterium]|jgi:poly-gamma-glutamate synthesis protein (capsule biosynthesis protein)|nr:CapA family protein [Actinomycetes bacterium]
MRIRATSVTSVVIALAVVALSTASCSKGASASKPASSSGEEAPLVASQAADANNPDAAATKELPPAPRPDLTITAVGDLTFSRSGGASFGTPKKLLSNVKATLKKADITYGNLETPLSARGKAADKTFTFRGPKSAAAAMASAGFDIVSVSNNHSLDYGRSAFADTRSALKKAKVAAVGGGKNKKEAWKPVVIKRKKATVAFLAFSEITPANFAATSTKSGCSYTQDFAAVKKAVKAAAKKYDYLIVGMHWGIESQYAPTAHQVKEGRALIKAGAAAVLGSHPHVLQGVEFYKKGLIAYSMGNFVFSPGSAKGRDSAILTLKLTDKGVTEVSAKPVKIEGFTPKVKSGTAGKRILNILKKGSKARGTKVSIKGNTITFKKK